MRFRRSYSRLCGPDIAAIYLINILSSSQTAGGIPRRAYTVRLGQRDRVARLRTDVRPGQVLPIDADSTLGLTASRSVSRQATKVLAASGL